MNFSLITLLVRSLMEKEILMKISLIIPAYNEEKRIKKTLLDYDRFLQSNYSDYEIIVVCDGCQDHTPMIVKDFTEINSRIKLLEFEHRLGKGGGLIEGFKNAAGEIIGFTDADGATSPFEYKKLIESVMKDVDVVIGSRKVKGAKIAVHQSIDREFASKIFNLFINMVFALSVHDTQCGAKVFKRDVIENILPKLVTRGFEIDVELLWRAKKENYKLKEIPIVWEHKEEAVFNFKFIPNMFIGLLKLSIRGHKKQYE